MMIILSTYNIDPVVVVDKPNITVPENQTEVEVCITLSTGITEQVEVIAVTGPKAGAADQATGRDFKYLIFKDRKSK